jgi:S1-C subfamily serine protease
MIISPSGAYAGIGFAVPVDTIKKIVPQIIQHGKVIRPGLGIRPLQDAYARRLGIEGMILGEVPEGGAAFQAGLRGLARNRRGQWIIQDIIVGIDDNPIKSYDDYYNIMDKYQIGDRVTLTVQRNRKERKVRMRLVKID